MKIYGPAMKPLYRKSQTYMCMSTIKLWQFVQSSFHRPRNTCIYDYIIVGEFLKHELENRKKLLID